MPKASINNKDSVDKNNASNPLSSQTDRPGLSTWNATVDWIREKMSTQAFDTWFAPVEFDSFTSDKLNLLVPNSFFEDWLRGNYLTLIEDAWHVQSGRQAQVSFAIGTLKAPGDIMRQRSVSVTPAPTKAAQPAPSRLNPKYTFKNFVVGSSNQLPHAASLAAATRSGASFNPLFIYGGVGLGKTHLLHAIGNHVYLGDNSKRVIYMSSEEFMNEFVASLQTNQMDSFRRRYRKDCDVLLIDDIQFIAGKDRTQDEFFHTFNALYEDNKQIVMTSDKYPQEIPDLEERLRSRFQWGLIADIQTPELETRIAILKRKAEEENIPLPNDVAFFLASSIKTNIRELEGSLINLAAHALLENRRIDMDFANDTLRKIIALHQSALSVESVLSAVCKHFNVTQSELRGQKRHRSVVFPRQVAMYLCRKGLKSSYPEIGNQFGGKDHTTAMAACRKIDKIVKEDPSMRGKIEALERLLGF